MTGSPDDLPGSSVTVCLDATAVPAKPGGAGRYVLSLARALATTDDVDITIVCRQGDRARWEEQIGSESVIDMAPSRRPLRLAWEQAALPRLLNRLPVDVHHGPHYTMPLLSNRPTVVTVHDLSFFSHPEWHQPAKVAFFRGAIRVAAARADAIVAVSRTTAERFQARSRPQAPVHVIPHGVDHDRFRPAAGAEEVAADEAARARLGIEPDAKYVAFVGTLEPRKDVPSLVRAFDRVAQGHPDITLVLAGNRGWGGNAVESAVGAAAAQDRILMTGYVTDTENVALLRGAAVVAYPSLEEGFGLPAVETLACGTPLVTTSGSAMEEVAVGSALLVTPGNVDELAEALDATLSGGPEVERRRLHGLEVAAGHTWQESAAAHAQLYRSVR